MRRYLWSIGLFTFMAAVILSGCTKPALRDKPPPDPLLTSKKPVEGKPHISDARSLVDEDYSPPVRPARMTNVRQAHER